jgi:hypothetical protein
MSLVLDTQEQHQRSGDKRHDERDDAYGKGRGVPALLALVHRLSRADSESSPSARPRVSGFDTPQMLSRVRPTVVSKLDT